MTRLASTASRPSTRWRAYAPEAVRAAGAGRSGRPARCARTPSVGDDAVAASSQKRSPSGAACVRSSRAAAIPLPEAPASKRQVCTGAAAAAGKGAWNVTERAR